MASKANGGGCGRAKRAAGGGPASEASLPPEASQVAAEGSGLRVLHTYLLIDTVFHLFNLFSCSLKAKTAMQKC